MIVVIILYLLLGIVNLSSAAPQKILKSKNPNHSSNASLVLIGDSDLCLLLGRTIGTYSAGGNPEDVYEWIVTKSTGEEIFSISGGLQFETIQVLFIENGDYTVSLKVRRGTDASFFQDTMKVTVKKGPDKLALLPDYLLCGDSPAQLSALDPNTSTIENYSIYWKDIDQNVLGSGNEFLAYSPGIYLVEIYSKNPDGNQTCTINGSTYVGPAIDFNIMLSSSKICEGSLIDLSTDTPLSGEWFIKKKSGGIKRSLGKGFEIKLESNELDGPGLYEVSFSVPSIDYPDCSSERKKVFEIAQAPELEIQIIENPDQCSNHTGSFQIKAISDLESIAIPELDFYQKDVSKGQIFTFDELKAKVYVLNMVQNNCTTNKLIQLNSKDWASSSSPVQLTFSISQKDESCSVEDIIPGKVQVAFTEQIDQGKYRILSSSDGIVKAGIIPAEGNFEVDLNSGNYLLELIVDDCTYPLEPFTILDKPQVKVSVPANITVCESYLFIPESTDDLLMTLSFPDGEVQSLETGSGFTLFDEGNYSLLAEPLDINSTLCPKRFDFSVTLLTPFSYTPLLIEENCFDPIKYRAELEGVTPDEVSFRWMDSDATIVGRGQEFYPPSIGKFSLIVIPVGSGFCPTVPVEFEVLTPIRQVSMDLEFKTTCADPEALIISLSTNKKEVVEIEWIFYDESNIRQELPNFEDPFDIRVNKSGTYEAVAYNKLGCEIGRNLIPVEISTSYILPELDDLYPVCSRKNSIPAIDPGEHAEYAWYFEEQLVSTERFYKPTEIGNYQLLLTTENGCVLEENFTTHDVCNFKSIYPNAMILGNPNKNFRVLLSSDITEAELFILNRQGDLINHNYTNDIPGETPVLCWDGKSNGRYVPTGNYAVVVVLRNKLYGIDEKITGALLVLK